MYRSLVGWWNDRVERHLTPQLRDIRGRNGRTPSLYRNRYNEVEKRCNACGEWLPLTDEYWYDRPSVRTYCKACWSEYNAARVRSHGGTAEPRLVLAKDETASPGA